MDEGKSMSILRVDGDVRANAGDCMLAGGQYWSEVWVWEQGVTVMDPTTIPEAVWPGEPKDTPAEAAKSAIDQAIRDHSAAVKNLDKMPTKAILALPDGSGPGQSPARFIIEALTALGWAPPPVYPEGVQVWTISGIPDAGRSDGTQAYLSLPTRTGKDRFDYQARSDIWLEKPTVTVNF